MSLHYSNYEEYEEAVNWGAERDEDYEGYTQSQSDNDPDWDSNEASYQPQG